MSKKKIECERKQKNKLNRPRDGGSTSKIMNRNYPWPNPLAFDGVRHSNGIVFPATNRHRMHFQNICQKYYLTNH